VLRIYAEALDRLRVRLNMYLVRNRNAVNDAFAGVCVGDMRQITILVVPFHCGLNTVLYLSLSVFLACNVFAFVVNKRHITYGLLQKPSIH